MSNVKNRGFASMSPERRKEVAKLGAAASVASGKGHRFTPVEAKSAARKSHIARGRNVA